MKSAVLALLVLTAAFGVRAQDLDAARQQADLNKRSEMALTAAESAMARAKRVVKESGARADLESALKEIEEASALALQALKDTGKPPKKLGRQYKKGELKTRGIVKHLEDLILALGVENRPPAEAVRDHVTKIHDEFLIGVMGQSK